WTVQCGRDARAPREGGLGQGQRQVAASQRIFAILRLGGSRSHAESLDGSDRDRAWLGNGRMQQMRGSRLVAKDVQDWRWNALSHPETSLLKGLALPLGPKSLPCGKS